MQGKTVLITGGNSGIGLAAAHDFAARGARVCIACRDQAKARQALAEIRARTPGAELELYIETGRSAEAAELAGQLCRTFPGSARILFLSGKLAYRQKRYNAAESLFRESLRIHRSPQIQYWLGRKSSRTPSPIRSDHWPQ